MHNNGTVCKGTECVCHSRHHQSTNCLQNIVFIIIASWIKSNENPKSIVSKYSDKWFKCLAIGKYEFQCMMYISFLLNVKVLYLYWQSVYKLRNQRTKTHFMLGHDKKKKSCKQFAFIHFPKEILSFSHSFITLVAQTVPFTSLLFSTIRSMLLYYSVTRDTYSTIIIKQSELAFANEIVQNKSLLRKTNT